MLCGQNEGFFHVSKFDAHVFFYSYAFGGHFDLHCKPRNFKSILSLFISSYFEGVKKALSLMIGLLLNNRVRNQFKLFTYLVLLGLTGGQGRQGIMVDQFLRYDSLIGTLERVKEKLPLLKLSGYGRACHNFSTLEL